MLDHILVPGKNMHHIPLSGTKIFLLREILEATYLALLNYSSWGAKETMKLGLWARRVKVSYRDDLSVWRILHHCFLFSLTSFRSKWRDGEIPCARSDDQRVGVARLQGDSHSGLGLGTEVKHVDYLKCPLFAVSVENRKIKTGLNHLCSKSPQAFYAHPRGSQFPSTVAFWSVDIFLYSWFCLFCFSEIGSHCGVQACLEVPMYFGLAQICDACT